MEEIRYGSRLDPRLRLGNRINDTAQPFCVLVAKNTHLAYLRDNLLGVCISEQTNTTKFG